MEDAAEISWLHERRASYTAHAGPVSIGDFTEAPVNRV
jgi:hypothetical protein